MKKDFIGFKKIFKVLTLFIVIFVFSDCQNTEKVRKGEILKDDIFYKVLIDIHKADGIIASTNIRTDQKMTDSVSLYNYVLKKNNVSRPDFIKTVEYYTIHPEKYIVFYDSLESYFDKLNTELAIESEKNKPELNEKKDSSNLWNLKTTWRLPQDGKTNTIAYNIPVDKQGTYTLSAHIKVFRDDKSKNQRLTIIANYHDGTKDINTIGTLLKEEKFDEYEVSLTTDPGKQLKSISGWLLDHSKGTKSKHVHVKNITLRLTKEID